ncbi:MAG: hypothetical protein CMN30_10625 [Sandaracinus sp.]|nr:hypothetical protein [Sandaracinus sp.]|tara:strand:- start:1659 stop:1979 length:321 start_codon:yes stop_codon:yes gene_type:complete
MRPLFITVACDRCDGPSERDWCGYVVWRKRPSGSQEYVFRTRADADRWKRANGLEDFDVRMVYTDASINWRESQGTLQDIVFADRLFEIYHDVRYRPAVNRAHLAA